MRLRFLQVDQSIAARDDVAASAALVHGGLSSLQTLAGGEAGFRVDDIADAMGWAPRSVQRALAQLVELALVDVVPAEDGRVRRYRLGSAPRTAGNADTSAPRTAGKFAPRAARIAARSAPRAADTSAPQMAEMPAADGAHLAAVPLSSDQERSDLYTGSPPIYVTDQAAWLARFDRQVAGELGRLAEFVQRAIGDAQIRHGGARPPLDTGSRWLRLAEWCVETSREPARPMPLADVIEQLAEGWASDVWAKRAGYPVKALIDNPQKYFTARGGGMAPISRRFLDGEKLAAREVREHDDERELEEMLAEGGP